MIKLTGITLLAIVLNSRCASRDPVIAPGAVVGAMVTTLASTTTTGPAILEADVDGIGPATIANQTILVKLPAGYTKSTIRLTYKLTADVKKVTPASGQDIPVRAGQPPVVCIQNDALGNCTRSYQLVIQQASAVRATVDPASRQLDVTRYLQPYSLTFQLSNLKAQPGVTRRFQLRFVNKTTGYTYVGDNYMVNDKTGNVIFVNQSGTAVPDDAQLLMTGTLPLDMPTGEYMLTILAATCYSPTAEGLCVSAGTEGIELAGPFVLRAGPALVGDVSPMPTTASELLIKGRNFSATQPLAVRFTSDFTQPANASGTVESETAARLALPTALVSGQYRVDVSPPGGQPYSSLFTVPGPKTQPVFSYVAPLGSYVATHNPLPVLPTFKGGETLEIRYAAGYTQAVKAIRLIDTKDSSHTANLTGNVAFRPYAGATDFVMWQWTLPAGLSRGTYTLVFDGTDGTSSLPYYQAIRIE